MAQHDGMTIGIRQFRSPREQRLDRMLTQPFRDDDSEYPTTTVSTLGNAALVRPPKRTCSAPRPGLGMSSRRRHALEERPSSALMPRASRRAPFLVRLGEPAPEPRVSCAAAWRGSALG
jgi:hypothetical protein